MEERGVRVGYKDDGIVGIFWGIFEVGKLFRVSTSKVYLN